MRVRNFTAAFAALALLVAFGAPARGSSVTGNGGIDTSIAATDSVTTVAGRGSFSDLKITVNQTKNLLNQAISVTWTGGRPTIHNPATFSGNYLQIFECWGDDDGTNTANPGPPPEKCVMGARNGVKEHNVAPFPTGSLATDRVIARDNWQDYNPADGPTAPGAGEQWMPFESVKGETVGVGVDYAFNPSVEGGVYWKNPFFNIITTNEIAGGQTQDNGTGAELFEVQTGIENAGLGCGQSVEPAAGGGTKVPKCWLVVVPRGTPTVENANTPYGGEESENTGVMTSPLSTNAWKNRIAIPLEFNPVDSSCSITDDAARLAGTELAQAAIASWQPILCTTPGLRPYSYGNIQDTLARQQLVIGGAGAPGMIVVTKPIDQDRLDPDSPVVYAPLTLSGLSIAFNVERRPKLGSDDDAQKLAQIRFATINLTPRLLAKLLTQSYKRQTNIIQQAPYDWVKTNPDNLNDDPDFVQFNPEFKEQDVVNRRTFSGLVAPSGISDAAQLLWQYVLADPEAKAWLDGKPDPFGMVVNPVYNTDASKNPSGQAFADPIPNSFPKSDPYCFQEKPLGPQKIIPPPLCGTDNMPAAQSFHDAAHSTRAADDGAKLNENTQPFSSASVWQRVGPQTIGKAMLSLTDTASANIFGTQSAKLSRAGDDGDDRKFIAPDQKSLAAAVAGMSAKDEAAVLEPDPLAKAPDGYPLAMLSYAAIKPLDLTADQRREYAAFVSYGVGDGQVPGLKYGELPVGYAPLPDVLKTQSVNAAKAIVDMKAPADEEDDVPRSGSDDMSNTAGDQSASSFFDLGDSSSFSSFQDAATITNPVINFAAPSSTKSASPKRVLTPAVSVPGTKYALPALLLLALLAGLGALEITKRPRRRAVS